MGSFARAVTNPQQGSDGFPSLLSLTRQAPPLPGVKRQRRGQSSQRIDLSLLEGSLFCNTEKKRGELTAIPELKGNPGATDVKRLWRLKTYDSASSVS